MPHSRIAVACFMVYLLVVSCARNDRNPIGTDLPDEDWYGEGPFLDTLFVEEGMTARINEGAGASPFLLVGAVPDLVSRALIKISLFPAAESVFVANLELQVHDLIETDAINLNVYALTNPDWIEAEATWNIVSGRENEESVSWGVPGGDFDNAVLLGQSEITGSSIDTTVSIVLNVDIINAWIDSTVENSGIILIAEDESGTPGLVEFRSRQSVSGEDFLGPQLYIEYNKADDPDSTVEGRISITEDVSIYRYDGRVPEGALRVGLVPQYRSYLNFDVNGFSEAASVRRATLVLPVLGRVPSDRNIVFGAYPVTGDWNGEFTPQEFTPLDSVEVTDGNEVALNITRLAWGWINGTVDNKGVALKGTVERGKYVYVDLKGRENGEKSGPRCIIEYTLPPGKVMAPHRKEKQDDM